MPSDDQKNRVQLLWGAAEIGRAIGRSKRQTFHLLENGELRGAIKKGNRWCIDRPVLEANFRPSLEILRSLVAVLGPEEREALFRGIRS